MDPPSRLISAVPERGYRRGIQTGLSGHPERSAPKKKQSTVCLKQYEGLSASNLDWENSPPRSPNRLTTQHPSSIGRDSVPDRAFYSSTRGMYKDPANEDFITLEIRGIGRRSYPFTIGPRLTGLYTFWESHTGTSRL